MTASIVPFAKEHITAAGALLAARHQRDREWAPDLPPRYADADAARSALQQTLSEEGISGVAAMQAGNLAGFLLGAPVLSAPTRAFAGFMRPRAAEIFYDSHAVAPGEGNALYRRMYAPMAERWVADGLTSHYITVAMDAAMETVWSDLGFARFIEMGVRDTEPPAVRDAAKIAEIEVRRAGPEDEEAVQELATDLFRSWAEPPIFLPFLPETAAARRTLQAELLADPACPHWLAVVDGRVVGMQIFTEPGSTHWNVSTLQSPERCVYLYLACTLAEARGAGIGDALFRQTMAWARDAGYERCAVHFVTQSRAAAFWRGLGFRPASHWMTRHIDERATWAHGRS